MFSVGLFLKMNDDTWHKTRDEILTGKETQPIWIWWDFHSMNIHPQLNLGDGWVHAVS